MSFRDAQRLSGGLSGESEEEELSASVQQAASSVQTGKLEATPEESHTYSQVTGGWIDASRDEGLRAESKVVRVYGMK